MPKARSSKEYTAFDKLMGKILTVPRADIERKMQEHRERAANNPLRPGPKPKRRKRKAVTPSAAARA